MSIIMFKFLLQNNTLEIIAVVFAPRHSACNQNLIKRNSYILQPKGSQFHSFSCPCASHALIYMGVSPKEKLSNLALLRECQRYKQHQPPNCLHMLKSSEKKFSLFANLSQTFKVMRSSFADAALMYGQVRKTFDIVIYLTRRKDDFRQISSLVTTLFSVFFASSL